MKKRLITLALFGEVVCALFGTPPDDRPNRWTSQKCHCSVLVPPGWTIVNARPAVMLVNYNLNKSIQGRIPSGGAEILVWTEQSNGEEAVKNFANKEIQRYFGKNVAWTSSSGPEISGVSASTEVSFEESEAIPGEQPLMF